MDHDGAWSHPASHGAAVPPGLRLTFVGPSGEAVTVGPGHAGHVPLDFARPARQIRSYRGQRHFPGYWWSATTGGHIIFESWLERHHIMAADRDPAATSRRAHGNRPDRPFRPVLATRPGEIVQIDTNTVDILCRFADGVVRRPELTLAVDLASRSIAGRSREPDR